jgi:polar amino acid transport system substrate-binding protein
VATLKQSIAQTNTMNQSQPLLTIGVDSTYPPMESIDNSGHFVGFDIDMGNMIAKSLGRKPVWEKIKFDDIFNDLSNNDYDIIISAITITPDREKKYDFSIPYINAGEVLIVQKTGTSQDNVLETAANFKGKTIGVEAGTTDVPEAMQLTSSNLVTQYPSNDPAISDLKSGKIDALITDLPNAQGILAANHTFRIATNPLTNEYYGIVFRKNEPALRNQINGILLNLQNQGILQSLTEKWLE